MKPPEQCRQRRRSRISPSTVSSGTSGRCRMKDKAAFIAAVCSCSDKLLAVRKTSPVERWQMPRRSHKSSACVPLPFAGRAEQDDAPRFAQWFARRHFTYRRPAFQLGGAVMVRPDARIIRPRKKTSLFHGFSLDQLVFLPSIAGQFPKKCRDFAKMCESASSDFTQNLSEV